MRRKNWSPALRAEVERLRRDFPMWGKDKLGPILRDQGFAVSNATVGRIIESLIARGCVARVADLIRKATRKTPPSKRPHAIRKPKQVAFEKPGDVIQIDTVSVTLAPNRVVKHFDAYDVHAKWTVAKPYRNATAHNAANFLDKVITEMPWPVKAIQIDGGSESWPSSRPPAPPRKSPSTSLPPRSPKLNGAVERCNGAWRYEFYACRDLPNDINKIAEQVEAFQHLYNHGPTAPSTEKRQTNIFKSAEPKRPTRLISLEPGQMVSRNGLFGYHRGRIREPPGESRRLECQTNGPPRARAGKNLSNLR